MGADIDRETVWRRANGLQVGWQTLQEEFNKLLEHGRTERDHDALFDELKTAVRDESMKQHKWDDKAEDSLVSAISLTTTWDDKAKDSLVSAISLTATRPSPIHNPRNCEVTASTLNLNPLLPNPSPIP